MKTLEGMDILEIQKNIAVAFALAKDTNDAMQHLVKHANSIEGIDYVNAYIFSEQDNQFILISDNKTTTDAFKKDRIDTVNPILENVHKGEIYHLTPIEINKLASIQSNMKEAHEIILAPILD